MPKSDTPTPLDAYSAWPAKKAVNAVTRDTTSVTTANVIALAA